MKFTPLSSAVCIKGPGWPLERRQEENEEQRSASAPDGVIHVPWVLPQLPSATAWRTHLHVKDGFSSSHQVALQSTAAPCFIWSGCSGASQRPVRFATQLQTNPLPSVHDKQ